MKPFRYRVSKFVKGVFVWSENRYIQFFVLALLAFDAHAHALSPSEVFDKVKNSVVVVISLDANGKAIIQGSGVLLPSGKIGTNCHVLKSGASFQVGGSNLFIPATLWGSDEDKDICLLEITEKIGEPAQLGQSSHLKVGDPVYAVGAPRGLELSLSDGIVSQLRGGALHIIQTTAAISPGSSGGGLFDAEGRLVGFTTLKIKGAQALNFAIPVEWAGEISPGNKMIQESEQGSKKNREQGRSWADWQEGAIAFKKVKDWSGMLNWTRQWTQAQPDDVIAWMQLSVAFTQLGLYPEAISAARKATQVTPELGDSWSLLGDAYLLAKRYQDAIESYQKAIDIGQPGLGAVWFGLGNSYSYIKRFPEAINALRQAIAIDPTNAPTWKILVLTYAESGNRTKALEALSQMRKIDPTGADHLVKLVKKLALDNKNAVDGWVIVGSDNNDTSYANPSTIRKNVSMVTMWSMLDFKKAKVLMSSTKHYKSVMEQDEYNCDEERSRNIALSWHSENMGKGQVVLTNSDIGEWIALPPDSRGKRLWVVACGRE
jgi:tetratricopeptide (TPR) repeat protein